MSESPAADVTVFPSTAALFRAAAEDVVARTADALRSHGRFMIALAGGKTPAGLYDLLASDAYAQRIEWERVEVFWGDERLVPPDDAASNYRMAHEHLLARVPVPERNVHRMRGEDDASVAAAAYERELRAAFATPDGPPRIERGARFDLILLGMGRDGHTASLFPGSASVKERERWVVAERADAAPSLRITLTPVVINAAAAVVFLVAGPDKAPVLRRVLEDRTRADALPAQVIAPRRGSVRWLVDAAAAAELRHERKAP